MERFFSKNNENLSREQKDKTKNLVYKKLEPYLWIALSSLVTIGGIKFIDRAKEDFEYENKIDKEKKENLEFEIKSAKEKAESYQVEIVAVNKDDLSRFFNDDFISEVAMNLNNNENIQNLISKKLFLSSTESEISDGYSKFRNKKDSARIKKEVDENMKSVSLQVEEVKGKISESEKKNAKDKIISILSLVEGAKIELLKHIGSDEYLNKLSKEMNISKEAAKEHQKVRINNIKNLTCDLKSSHEIFFNQKGGVPAYAYYDWNNKIVLPYNIDLNNKKEKDFFYEAILHEILHESTQYEKGMSIKSQNYLKKSFKPKDFTEEKDFVEYYSSLGELIVRKQILDLEMEKLDIKKYSERFTYEHYQKLLKLKINNKLSPNAVQFIEHIKPEKFIKIMNELAEEKNDQNNDGKIYYHPGWDYGDQENNV